MTDKTLEGYFSEFNDIINNLNSIADNIVNNAEGIGETNCQNSIKGSAKALRKIQNSLIVAYQNDLSNQNK